MNRKQEANAFVKECITTALLQMMEKQSFESISITALTNKAGVGRVSFYRNFESKEDIIRKHLAKLTQEWADDFSADPTVNLVESVFSHYYKHKDIFILLYKSGLWHLSLQSVKDACGPTPEQDNLSAYQSAFISYGLYGWLEEWFKRGLKETPEEMRELLEKAQRDSK